MKRGRTDGTVTAAVKATNKSKTLINKLNAVRAKVGQRTTFACAAAVISSGKCSVTSPRNSGQRFCPNECNMSTESTLLLQDCTFHSAACFHPKPLA